MVDFLIRFGLPFVAALVAVTLGGMIVRKKWHVRIWHGWASIGIAFCFLFSSISAQKTPFVWPLILTGLILVILSLAMFFAVERPNVKKGSDDKS